MISFEALSGKKVFLTGHTGFTGSWASIWLSQIGAEVLGYSLEPDTVPNLFNAAEVHNFVTSNTGDVRDYPSLLRSMQNFKPDLVLHLAAQPLVSRSYRYPRETFDINCQGTANVLEAVLNTQSVKGVLCVTTDKVYKNLETGRAFIENDELGGKDPYSSSKAAAELTINSYRELFRTKETAPILSVARGGNIIGGGDWSEDRIVPDFIRAFQTNQTLKVRNFDATRPWQHVISLLDGYFSILAGMLGSDKSDFDRAFNLGPIQEAPVSVRQLLRLLQDRIPSVKLAEHGTSFAEAELLSLNSSLAQKTFNWQPLWGTKETIDKTASWYQSYLSDSSEALELCLKQISDWSKLRAGELGKTNL